MTGEKLHEIEDHVSIRMECPRCELIENFEANGVLIIFLDKKEDDTQAISFLYHHLSKSQVVYMLEVAKMRAISKWDAS